MAAAAPQAPSKDVTKAEPHPSEEGSSAAKADGEDIKADKEISKDGGDPPAALEIPDAGLANGLDALEYPSVNLSFDTPSTSTARS